MPSVVCFVVVAPTNIIKIGNVVIVDAEHATVMLGKLGLPEPKLGPLPAKKG